MTYTPITDTTVTLDTLSVNQRGFGIPLVLDEHNFTLERIKFYSSITDAAVDLPSYSKAYKAVQAAFSVNPKPELVALGRRKCDATLLPDASPLVGDVHSVRISYGSTFTDISVTAGASPTVTSVGAALAAAINGVPAVAAVLSANSVAGLVTLTPVGVGIFKLSSAVKLTVGKVASVETVATTMTAIMAESVDFYNIFETGRDATYIQDLSAWVAATDYVMSYATSLSTTYSTDYSEVSADFPSVMKRAGRPRNINCVYVQADQLDLFPEVRIFSVRARNQPGDVIYSNLTNLGIQPAKTASGLLLTKTELGRLDARGLGYFEYVYGVVTFRRGRSQGAGESAWSDDQVVADFLKARINEAVATRFFNTNAEKLAGRAGYIQIANVIQDVCDRMTSNSTASRAFQEGSVQIYIPTDEEIKAARPGRKADMKVTAKLEGAWDSAEISVTLSY